VSRDASVLHQPDFLQGGTEATIAVRPNPLVLATTTGTRLLLHLKFRAQLDTSRQQARCSHYHMQVADADDRELVTFHSGHGEPRNNFPHVHVAMPRTLVHKKHLPTGEEDVKLAYVIYMLLERVGRGGAAGRLARGSAPAGFIKPYPHDQARLTPSQTSGLSAVGHLRPPLPGGPPVGVTPQHRQLGWVRGYRLEPEPAGPVGSGAVVSCRTGRARACGRPGRRCGRS